MIAKKLSHIEKYMHPSSKKNENTEPTLGLLEAIAYTRQRYYESMDDMLEQIATVEFSHLELVDISAIFQEFPFYKRMGRKAEELIDFDFHFQRCVSSLQQLKKNPKYGEIYYDIIVNKLIEGSDETNVATAKRYGISVPTYYVRRIEAINYTYQIWFGEGLEELAKLTGEIAELAKDVVHKNTKDNRK